MPPIRVLIAANDRLASRWLAEFRAGLLEEARLYREREPEVERLNREREPRRRPRR